MKDIRKKIENLQATMEYENVTSVKPEGILYYIRTESIAEMYGLDEKALLFGWKSVIIFFGVKVCLRVTCSYYEQLL